MKVKVLTEKQLRVYNIALNSKSRKRMIEENSKRRLSGSPRTFKL